MQKKKRCFVFKVMAHWVQYSIGVLILLVNCLQVMASPVSDEGPLDKKISIEFKNMPLRDCLSKLEQVAHISFSYVDNDIFKKEKINLSFKNERVGKILHKILSPFYFGYSVVEGDIVLWYDAAKAGSAGFLPSDDAALLTISGIVADENHAPLSGASVLLKGTRNGMITNGNGAFENFHASKNAVIVFSIAGYQTREVVAFDNEAPLNVQLKKKITSLQEVVITGFQNIDKKKFSGASVRLKADEINMNGATDISRMLEGRAAGVSVQNVSGTFGSAPKVRVRGPTSIMGENKPLWVVDGIVLEDLVNISNDQLSSGDPATLLSAAVAGLNANDIESFDILKDAAATALYGARAMNGVIVITTKKGKVGKPLVSYTGNFATQLKPGYRNFNIMNSSEQMSLNGELERKGLLNSVILDDADYGMYGKMYQMIDSIGPDGCFMLQNSPAAKNEFLEKYALANTDWFGVLFRNNLMQEHSISISSGTEKSQTYFSTSFYSDNGWTIGDKVNRYTMDFHNNYKVTDKLSAGFSTIASVRMQRAPGSINRQENSVEGTYDRDFDINPFNYALTTSRALTAFDSDGKPAYFTKNFAPFNIINELRNNYIDLSVIDIRLQGELAYRISKSVKYEFSGALRYVKSTREHNVTEQSNMANAYRAASTTAIRVTNKFLYYDPDKPLALPTVVLPYGGFYNRTENDLNNYDLRQSITFNKNFLQKHSVNILMGNQVKSAERQDFSNTGYGYQYDNGGTAFINPAILKQTIEHNFPYYQMGKSYDRFVAFYANAQYTFDNRFNFLATTRYDGSNKLGESRTARWLPTWTTGGSWNIDNETFMQDITWLNYLKLRGSYGLTASMGPATSASAVFRDQITRRANVAETETATRLRSLKNADLTWEKNYTGNIGIDGGLIKNRVIFSVDVYRRKSFDLVDLIKTSAIGGGGAYKYANYADMKSRGAEVMLGVDMIRNRNFNWRTHLTVGYNTTVVTKLKNIPSIFDLVRPEGGSVIGHPVNGLFAIDYVSLVHDFGVPIFKDEKGVQSPAVNLQDQSIDYLKYQGPVDPLYTGGLSNSLAYKAVTLNVLLTCQFGNKIRLNPAFPSSFSDLSATPKELNDRWEIPGDEHYTSVPSVQDILTQYLLEGAYPLNNYNYSTARVARGDMIRLKSVSLVYNVAPALLRRAGIATASVSATSNNLWLIYADKRLGGQDPEFFNAGGVAQPLQKQFSLSLKIGI